MRSCRDCYCKTGVPITAKRGTDRRETISKESIDDDSMEAGSSTVSGSSSMLSPETRNVLDKAERIARNAEMEILEIGSVLQRRPRRSLKIRTYKDDPPLDDQDEQLLYIKELVLSKFLETEHDQQNIPNIPEEDPRDEPKKISVPQIDEDPPEIQNEKPVDENVLVSKGPGCNFSKEGPKFVDAKRKRVDDERMKRMENFCVQIPPALSIDRKLKTQKLMDLNIPPDPGFVEGNSNVASFEYFHGVGEKRKEKLVKISEEQTKGKFVGEPKIRPEGKTGGTVKRTRIRFKEEIGSLVDPIGDKARAESRRGNREELEESIGDRGETESDKENRENKKEKSEEDMEENKRCQEKDNKIEDKRETCKRFVILQSKEEETHESRNVEITGQIGSEGSIGHSSTMDDSNRLEIGDGIVESVDEREQQKTIMIMQQQQQLKSREAQEKNVNEQREDKSQHIARILENAAAKNHGVMGENLVDRFRVTDERFSKISAKYGVRTVLRKDSSDSTETSIDGSLDEIRLYRPSVEEFDDVLAGYREAIETVIRSNRSIDRFLAGSIKYLSPDLSDTSDSVSTSKFLEFDRNVDPGKEDSVVGKDFAGCKMSRFEGKEQTDFRKGPASILKKDGARDCLRKVETNYCDKMAEDFGSKEIHGEYSKREDFWEGANKKMKNYKEAGKLLENKGSGDLSERNCKLRFAVADSCKIVDDESPVNKGSSVSTIINLYDIMKPENFRNILIKEKENLVLRLLQSKKPDIENDSKDWDGNFENVISKVGPNQNRSKIDPKVAEREENANEGNFEIGVLRKEPEILRKEHLLTEELKKNRNANRRNSKIDIFDMSESQKSVESGENISIIISERSNSQKKMNSSENDSKIISEKPNPQKRIVENDTKVIFKNPNFQKRTDSDETISKIISGRSTIEKRIDFGRNDSKIIFSEMSNFQKAMDQSETSLKIVSEKSNSRTKIDLDENNSKNFEKSISEKREDSTDGSLAEIPNIKSDRENSAEKNSKTESKNSFDPVTKSRDSDRKISDNKMKIANESPILILGDRNETKMVAVVGRKTVERNSSTGNSSEDFQTKNESANKNIYETKIELVKHSKTENESVGQCQRETKNKMATQISENVPISPKVSNISDNSLIFSKVPQTSENLPISPRASKISKNPPIQPEVSQTSENLQIHPESSQISKNIPPHSKVSQNSTDSSENSQNPECPPTAPKIPQNAENAQIAAKVPRTSKNSPPPPLSPIPKSLSISDPSRELEEFQKRCPDRPENNDPETKSLPSSKRSSPILRARSQKNGHHPKTSLRESTTLRSVLGSEASHSILDALEASCIEENSRKILTGDSSLRGSILKKFAHFRSGPPRIFCSTFASGDSSSAEKNFRSLSSSSGTESTKTETENSRSEGEFCVSSSYSIGEVKIKNAKTID